MFKFHLLLQEVQLSCIYSNYGVNTCNPRSNKQPTAPRLFIAVKTSKVNLGHKMCRLSQCGQMTWYERPT